MKDYKNFLNESSTNDVDVMKVVDEFISTYKTPIDLVKSGHLTEDNNIADIVIYMLEEHNLNIKSYLKTVIDKIIEINPDYGEVWKEF